MSPDTVVYLAKEALYAVLLISAPLLGGSLLIGLLVSIFQATTQIQEATLAFVPKIVVVLAAIVFFGPWMLNAMLQYAYDLFSNLHSFTFIR